MAEDREITIYDIARHLKISAATVSRGLQNNPVINKNTRKKIAETAQVLGYRSNTFASSLRSRQTHTIGVLVPRLNSHFMMFVPSGRSISPITKTDWEVVGVQPDIKVSADDALETAQLLILKEFLKTEKDPMWQGALKESIAELD